MYTVGDIAAWVQGHVVGDCTRPVARFNDLASAGGQDISFLTHPRYMEDFKLTQAGCVLVRQVYAIPHSGCSLVVCADPYLALAQISARLAGPPCVTPGLHATAQVHPSAHIDASACIGANAVVEAGAQIGPRVTVGAQAFVGAGSRIGQDSCLHPGAKVLAQCQIGQRTILHTGCVIGSDGFGFATERTTGRHYKIPQTGTVEVGDDVEIGANSTVDRATFGSTRIGHGTKIDNLVQIGHNVVLGQNCIVVSQSGIAGSTTLGDNVMMGAQSGVGGHLTVTDNVMLAARAGVLRNITAPGVYSGLFDVMPHQQALKIAMAQAKLPELRRRVQQVERKLADMAPQPNKT